MEGCSGQSEQTGSGKSLGKIRDLCSLKNSVVGEETGNTLVRKDGWPQTPGAQLCSAFHGG